MPGGCADQNGAGGVDPHGFRAAARRANRAGDPASKSTR
jgi:hypothetical protein